VLLLVCAAFINGHSSPHVKPGLQSGITPNAPLCLPCAEDYSTQNLNSHRSVGLCTQLSPKILSFHKFGHFSLISPAD